MRIASRSYIDSLSHVLARASNNLQRLSVQLTSGKRFTKPSDNPVDAGVIIRSHADLAAVVNQQRTIAAGLRMAQAADGALDDIGEAMRKVKSFVLQANTSTVTEEGRRAIANEIKSIAAKLQDDANRQVNDRYLFAGYSDRTVPFIEGPGGVIQYQGDSGEQRVSVAPGRTAPATMPGDYLLNFVNDEGERAVPSIDKDVFALLEATAEAIEQGNLVELDDLGDQIEMLRDHVVQCRAQLGVYVQRLEGAQNAAKNQELGTRKQLSEIEDVDIAQAILELQSQQLTYQAALLAVGQVAQIPTLFEVAYR